MARFQSLPDRIDTITTSISDQAMCQNYGMVTTCNLVINTPTAATTKPRVEVTSPCACCAWTVPTGITTIFIEVWGAGGGGGGSGNCCCCSQGPGGGGGGYVSQTITTVPGCVYTLCVGAGGNYGCAACTNATQGGTSYVTGYNLTNLCAVGGAGGTSGPCNDCNQNCYGSNTCILGRSFGGGTYANNIISACGEGGHLFGKPIGCRNENKGGSAPFNGGIGAWWTYISCCMYAPNWGGVGGDFPGGGGSGAPQTCCCGICNCGACGAGGFVRIWY